MKVTTIEELFQKQKEYNLWLASYGFDVATNEKEINKLVNIFIFGSEEFERICIRSQRKTWSNIGFDLYPATLVEDFLSHHRDEFWEKTFALYKSMYNYMEYNNMEFIPPISYDIPDDKEVIINALYREEVNQLLQKLIDIIDNNKIALIAILGFIIVNPSLCDPFLTTMKETGITDILDRIVYILSSINNITIENEQNNTFVLYRLVLTEMFESCKVSDFINKKL